MDWVDAVAQRADRRRDEVSRVLSESGVSEIEIPPRPHPLRISHIEFSGTKNLEERAGPFKFEWDIGGGVWAVASEDDNFVGKSTVLEVVRWALRGRPDLQQDVKNWMERVAVAGSIDNEPYRVEFDVRGGEPVGNLEADVTVPFSGARAFENVISAFIHDTTLGTDSTAVLAAAAGRSREPRSTAPSVGWLLRHSLHRTIKLRRPAWKRSYGRHCRTPAAGVRSIALV